MKSRATARCDEIAFPDIPFSPHAPRWYRERFVSTAKNFDILFSSVLARAAEHHKGIAIDEDILGGTPRLANTRIPVYMILDAIEYYGNIEGALKSYPHLSKEQVKEAMSFAAEVLEQPLDNKSQTPIG
jgi:uncharacterized protein (DUF433 family)